MFNDSSPTVIAGPARSAEIRQSIALEEDSRRMDARVKPAHDDCGNYTAFSQPKCTG
jgi:hypothetical protein